MRDSCIVTECVVQVIVTSVIEIQFGVVDGTTASLSVAISREATAGPR